MNQLRTGLWLIAAAWMTGCATHVAVLETHREDVSAQSKVLAVAARNLEEIALRQRHDDNQARAARAVAAFHAEAESFARIAGAWRTTDQVNTQYEHLAAAWVEVKHTFPALAADSLAQDAYRRVADEWEKLHRTAGYAARSYERKLDQDYDQHPAPR